MPHGSPDEVRNFPPAAVLTWTASSNADYPGETIIANEPVFDFSLNINNDPIIITIDNVDNLVGLTRLYIPTLDITNFDISQCF